MTLKPEVLAAMTRANFEAGRCTRPHDVFPLYRADWTTLSAELLAMDARLSNNDEPFVFFDAKQGKNNQQMSRKELLQCFVELELGYRDLLLRRGVGK